MLFQFTVSSSDWKSDEESDFKQGQETHSRKQSKPPSYVCDEFFRRVGGDVGDVGNDFRVKAESK